MRYMRRLIQAFGGFGLAALLVSMVAFGGGVPLIPSTATFAEPNQVIPTLNTFIQQLNGNPGYTGAAQVISLGQYCETTGTATTQTCTGHRGQVGFTNQGTITAGSTLALTITDTLITASNRCRANIVSQTVAASSGLTAPIVTPAAGSIGVTVQNPTATATGAAGAFTVMFDCVQ